MLSITQPNHSVDKRTLNSSDTFGILIYSPTGKVKMNLAQSIKTVSELKGQFTLRSGMVSNTYFDKYQFESDPKLLCLLYTSPSPRDRQKSRMPSSA